MAVGHKIGVGDSNVQYQLEKWYITAQNMKKLKEFPVHAQILPTSTT